MYRPIFCSHHVGKFFFLSESSLKFPSRKGNKIEWKNLKLIVFQSYSPCNRNLPKQSKNLFFPIRVYENMKIMSCLNSGKVVNLHSPATPVKNIAAGKMSRTVRFTIQPMDCKNSLVVNLIKGIYCAKFNSRHWSFLQFLSAFSTLSLAMILKGLFLQENARSSNLQTTCRPCSVYFIYRVLVVNFFPEPSA